MEKISKKLHKDLPGLRGFSKSNLYEMRKFYEEWKMLDPNFPVATGKIKTKDSAVATAELYNLDSQIDI